MRNNHKVTFNCRIITVLFAISAVALPYDTVYALGIETFPAASPGNVITNAGIPVEFAILPNIETSAIRYIRIDYDGNGSYDFPNSPNFNPSFVTFINNTPWLNYSTNTANWQYTGYGEKYSYLFPSLDHDMQYIVHAVALLANNTEVHATQAITVTAGQSWPSGYINHTPFAGMAGTYGLDSYGVPTTSDFFGGYLLTTPGTNLTLNATKSSDPDAQYGDNALRYWWQVGYTGGKVDIYTTEPIVTLSADVYSFLQISGAGDIQLTVIDRWGKEDVARAIWDNTMVPPVPIPSTALLLGSAVAALAGYRRRSATIH